MEASLMRLYSVSLSAVALLLAGSAQAAVKFYDSSVTNGTPSDTFTTSADLSPPVSPDIEVHQGYARIIDDGTGTVTLSELLVFQDQDTDLQPDRLVSILGPGAFFFGVQAVTQSIAAPHVSNTSGVGAHGPSSTSPGASAEWGLISGWQVTGFTFCLSSPPLICNANVSPHGFTTTAPLYSNTYDLGTWDFDAAGDMEADSPYILVTANGGITNVRTILRGAFHGASLPALPLVGFGALACALLVLGGRAMRGAR
jgi:hypothetical protein